MTEWVMHIDGMTCMGCAKSVQGALEKVNGVKSAIVNLEQKRANICYDSALVSPTVLEKVVEEAGFDVVK